MPSYRTRLVPVVVCCLAVGAFAGCGAATPPQASPTAESDPERHRRAIRETEEKVRRDQDAEREAFRGMTKPLPQ